MKKAKILRVLDRVLQTPDEGVRPGREARRVDRKDKRTVVREKLKKKAVP